MVANPNSNLVFDFPDPTPRFEFNESPTRTAKPTATPPKRGRRFGKFGKSKAPKAKDSSGGGNDKDDSFGNSTAATESLNASLDSTLSAGTVRARNTGSGDIAGGPSSGSGSGYAVPHFDSPPKLNLPSRPSPPPASSRHSRNPSLANSDTGYISEVSEFSFDRVTVTTNDQSSVSWGFLDDGVLNAVGALGGGQTDGTIQPYTGAGAGPATTNGGPGATHEKKVSSSTFSNVSVSDDELDHIPMSGIVDSNQSVISEISEKTGGGPAGDIAVKALLREGMETVRAKEQQSSPARRKDGARELDKAKNSFLESFNPDKAKSSSSPNTQNTVKSTITTGSSRASAKNLWTDVADTYKQFKTSRNHGQKERGSILQSIVEDVQFCGLYFCGIDTTTVDGPTDGDKYEDAMKKKKEERKREADDTFLGKVISFGSGTCGMCVEL